MLEPTRTHGVTELTDRDGVAPRSTASGRDDVILADVLDIPAIQALMDDLYALTGMGIGIIDLEGRILVATGWQDICTRFHRVHPEMLKHCITSDTELSSGVAPGEFRIYRCANNLWDIATPIMLGDLHLGNLFLGQFLFEGEEPDRKVFREQARKYGFDEESYLDALDRLPRWSRERVRQCMTFYAAFARQISDLSYGNVKLVRSLAQRDELLERLGENEERLRLALRATNDVVWDWDIVRDAQRWNESGITVFGWRDIVETPQSAGWWVERVHPEDRHRVEATFFEAVADPGVDRWSDSYRFRRADGSHAYVEDRGYILRDGGGRAVRMIGAMMDVTERMLFEDALERSRDLLNATEELSGVGGWEWDPSAEILTWTRGTYRLHDFDPGEFPAGSSDRIARSLACYDPGDRERVERAFRRCAEAGEEYDLECGFTTAAGRRLRVRTVGRAVVQQGRVVRVIGNLQDITDATRIREELQRSREAIEALINATEDCVFLMDLESTILVHNRETARRLDREGEDLTGLRIYDLLPPEAVARRREWVSTVASTGRPMREEDGRNGHVLDSTIYPLFDEDGRVTRVAVFSRDISDRKAAEDALRRSELSLKQAQKIGRLGNWEWDIEAGRLTWSDEVYRIWEVPPDFELTVESITARIHPDDREANAAWVRELLETSNDARFEFRIVLPDGGIRQLHQTAEVSRDASGRALRVIGIMQDITEQKRVIEDLRESEERFRAANDASLDSLILLHSDRDGTGEIRDFVFVDLNRRAVEMLRMNREDLLGRRLCEALPINREAGFFEKYKRVVETGEPLEEEFYLPDTHVPASWHYHQVVRVGDGVFIVHSDIGERKKAEMESERLQAQLLQSQKMESIGRLAGGIAHDFNNLLMGIMGYADLCRDEVGADHVIRPWLDEILTGTRRSADLTRQLLAFARKQVLQPRTLDLNEQIGCLLRMLGRLIGEHIEVTWSPGSGLRLVRADPTHIDQVLANLCVNAADAIEGTGRVDIATRNVNLDAASCTRMPELEPGPYVLLTVADDGCGMDEETLSHAFEPFFTTKEFGRGTGLGLATVYGIVHQSGGHIRIESTEGRGTLVRVYLPAIQDEEDVVEPDTGVAPLPGGHETILVVDDEKNIRETTAIQLQRLGYEVLTAGSPDMAQRLVRERDGTVDLLLTDVVMPGMSGIELRRRLLADRPGLRTIFITGYARSEPEGADADAESTLLLAKPVPFRDLALAVRSMLDRGRTTS